MFSKVWDFIWYWNLRYELVTDLYMAEPWEKRVVNCVLLAIILLVSYSSYMYLPHYTWTFLTYIFSLNEKVEAGEIPSS